MMRMRGVTTMPLRAVALILLGVAGVVVLLSLVWSPGDKLETSSVPPTSLCLDPAYKCALDIEVVDPWFRNPNWLISGRAEVDCADVGAGVHVRYASNDQFPLNDTTPSNGGERPRRIHARVFHYREADRQYAELGLSTYIPPDEVRILFRREPTASLRARTYESFHVHMGHGHRHAGENIYSPYPPFNLDVLFKKPSVDFRDKEPAAVAIYVQRHCYADSNRDEYVRQLMRSGLAIDSMGECLHNKEIPEFAKSWGRINDELGARYKFMIVMENTLCRDYLTEKIGSAFRSGSVPIVLSHRSPGTQTPSYDEVVPSLGDEYPPSRSYIDLADFPNAREAVEYINMVASNETLYRSYLWYRYADAAVQEKIRQSLLREGAIFYGYWPSENEPSQSVVCRAAEKMLAINQSKRATKADDGCVYPGVAWPLEGPVDHVEYVISTWIFTPLLIVVITMVMVAWLLRTSLVADAIARRSGSLPPCLRDALSSLTGRSIRSQSTL